MAGSDAMAASQASRIRNRKCRATPTTQAATIHADTITRILMVVAWTLRWSKEMRIRLNSGLDLGRHRPGLFLAGWFRFGMRSVDATGRNACSRRGDRVDHVRRALGPEELAAVNHRVLLS